MANIAPGTPVTFRPLASTHPMHHQHGQAGVVTGWNPGAQTYSLSVFLKDCTYLVSIEHAVEGPGPGEFQQLGATATAKK